MRKILSLFMLVMLVALTACGENKTGTSTTTLWEAQPPAQVEASALVTMEEAQTAVGRTIARAEQQDETSTVWFVTEEGTELLTLHAETAARNYYYAIAQTYSDAIETPNLGEAAIWSGELRELIVYIPDYLLSITVPMEEMEESQALTAARQIAAIAIERL